MARIPQGNRLRQLLRGYPKVTRVKWRKGEHFVRVGNKNLWKAWAIPVEVEVQLWKNGPKATFKIESTYNRYVLLVGTTTLWELGDPRKAEYKSVAYSYHADRCLQPSHPCLTVDQKAGRMYRYEGTIDYSGPHPPYLAKLRIDKKKGRPYLAEMCCGTIRMLYCNEEYYRDLCNWGKSHGSPNKELGSYRYMQHRMSKFYSVFEDVVPDHQWTRMAEYDLLSYPLEVWIWHTDKRRPASWSNFVQYIKNLGWSNLGSVLNGLLGAGAVAAVMAFLGGAVLIPALVAFAVVYSLSTGYGFYNELKTLAENYESFYRHFHAFPQEMVSAGKILAFHEDKNRAIQIRDQLIAKNGPKVFRIKGRDLSFLEAYAIAIAPNFIPDDQLAINPEWQGYKELGQLSKVVEELEGAEIYKEDVAVIIKALETEKRLMNLLYTEFYKDFYETLSKHGFDLIPLFGYGKILMRFYGTETGQQAYDAVIEVVKSVKEFLPTRLQVGGGGGGEGGEGGEAPISARFAPISSAIDSGNTGSINKELGKGKRVMAGMMGGITALALLAGAGYYFYAKKKGGLRSGKVGVSGKKR